MKIEASKATPTVRVDNVGAGFVGHLHGEAYRHVPGVHVVLQAVTATRRERATAFVAEFGVRKSAPGLEAILDEPVVDVAEVAQLVATPTFRVSTPCHMRVVESSNVEDRGGMLIRFDDGTVAQISASDVVLGGVRNQMAIYGAGAVVFANVNPNDALQAYAPETSVFAGESIVEKIETKAGWMLPQPGEEWSNGYPHERQDFVESLAFGREPLSGARLARDVTAVIYVAYLSAADGRRVDLRPFLG